jgi:hypothetical protein
MAAFIELQILLKKYKIIFDKQQELIIKIINEDINNKMNKNKERYNVYLDCRQIYNILENKELYKKKSLNEEVEINTLKKKNIVKNNVSSYKNSKMGPADEEQNKIWTKNKLSLIF